MSDEERSSTSWHAQGLDGHSKMRRLDNVATEASLHILAYNIKRVIALLGVIGLLAAMQG
ncbi:hypothetical protein LK533_16625 [Sphingomonas sp. PL-96]|uniref:hypothetical protein n=1 Tax=Sphingomonas sp. PL-96 TaxID=2887201 RepID=UPI001E63991B|nr:hypothetical protein [Sphingomonas sp. PL-96]MCC2978276.1 hypothetical protein [Sphingomonas sp. PL-96]